ncbi:MAG: outer membrane lipoprotein LolB [Nitrosomonadales bacterium]|nr:outer membrane lipoprotein LolB [Nitrosomonadales bacterium]
MRLASAVFALALAGCATRLQAPQPQVRPAQAGQAAFALNGRIAVKHDGERTTSNMRWTHYPTEDEILLFAPLGQTVARIRRDAVGVVLDTADKHYSAQDTEELTQRALGWHLPLDGLQYWVLALPAPGSKASIERDANGQVNAMRQDGWEIRYTRYTAQQPDSLPLRMNLQREGTELQLLVDEWEIR